MKQKIVLGILITKGKEHINKSTLTMHHIMTMIKIMTYVLVTKILMRTMKIHFIAFMALSSFNQSPTSM